MSISENIQLRPHRNMASNLNTTPDWISASGMRIDGAYELSKFMSADGGSAIFRTLLPGDLAPRGLARLFRLNAIAAARQRDLWQAVASVPHPNLQRIFSASVTEIGAELVACVITEGADETLAVELAERSLTAEETGELLLSLAPALNQLHTAGFVHGRVCPTEMFASGESIKISTDCATRAGEKAIAYRGSPTYVAPEQSTQNTTAAADVWCFGASLFQALTQSRYTAARLKEAHTLPAPFGRIIAGCLDPNPDARPSVAEVLALFQGRGVPQTAAPYPAEPPVVALKNTPQYAPAAGQPETRRRSPLVPVLIALSVVLVLFFFWLTKNKTPDKKPVTSPDAKAIVKQITPVPVPAVPQATAPNQPPASALPPKAEPGITNGPVWRVVLWTYRNRSNAQQKVDDLAARFPALHPEVFTPDPNGGMCLVVAGGGMTTLSQAQDTQRTARQLGLPRDIYIQKYTH